MNGLGQSPSPSDPVTGSRKRVSKACDTCRRFKEKCDGREPCERCRRTKHHCRFRETRRPGVKTAAPEAQRLRDQDQEFYNRDRILALEKIAKQAAGTEHLDTSHLVAFAASLSSSHTSKVTQAKHAEGLNSRATHPTQSQGSPCSEELSHHDFSIRFQKQVGIGLNGRAVQSESAVDERSPGWTHSQSTPSLVVDSTTVFPPREVALFLLDVFFEFVQTNYLYVDERSIRKSVGEYYDAPTELRIEDAPWACILLIIFAIGMQYAHLAARPNSTEFQASESNEKDEDVAQSFYRVACRLIPDVIAAASVESVQSFILFAVYSLPIDAAGLSSTYVGIALRIAVRNGLHRNLTDGLDSRELELRRVLFWTAYTLETRICIFHGLPTSILRKDVHCEYPRTLSTFQSEKRVDATANILAMIRLTERLEIAREVVSTFNGAHKSQQAVAAQSMLQFKSQLEDYWYSLPDRMFCRDITPTRSLFRFNQHLSLTYHLIHIVVGRSFLLNSDITPSNRPQRDSNTPLWERVRGELIKDSIRSALAVVDICQSLYEEIGLAKSSHTEFTTCCAAVLVLLAHRVSSRTRRLQNACESGIKFLKEMSVGIFSSSFERLTISTLETALIHLQDEAIAIPAADCPSKAPAYLQFRSWVAQQSTGAKVSESIMNDKPSRAEQEDDDSLGPHPNDAVGSQGMENGESGFLENSIMVAQGIQMFELNNLATSVPGLDQWFDLGFN